MTVASMDESGGSWIDGAVGSSVELHAPMTQIDIVPRNLVAEEDV